MQSDNSRDSFVIPPATSNSVSGVLVVVATLALLGNCLLTSPLRFSEAHEQDTSLLKPVITVLGLGGAFPTVRGIEVKNLVFYVGAGVLTLLGAVWLLTTRARPRFAGDDLLDVRNRATSAVFWWFVLLLASVISSMFSTAPDLSKGQSILRFIQFAWWLPLAMLLSPRDVRRLGTLVVVVLGLLGGLGVWYFVARNAPGTRLQYPIGNELWLGACLLPGIILAFALFVGRVLDAKHSTSGPLPSREGGDETSPPSSGVDHLLPAPIFIGLMLVAGSLMTAALAFTRARSAAAGLVAGIFALGFVLTSGMTRRVVLIVAILLGIAAGLWLQYTRVHGVMGQRAHSIRERLDYEWPYALVLFADKPVLGHGEGGYARLAGQFAREDQLDDPGTISFDQRSWVAHAHNELLDLMADLGFVGAFAFAAALALPIFFAIRYVDLTRKTGGKPGMQWLVAGLAGALVASVVESCGDNALRQPGLPAIFLTIWAMLWAIARTARSSRVTSKEDQWLGLSALRVAGLVALATAAFVGYYGVQDWRAARARCDADQMLQAGTPGEAIPLADFAGRHTLDAFQCMNARLRAAQARYYTFTEELEAAAADRSMTPDKIIAAQSGLVIAQDLDRAAPRFLQVSKVQGELLDALTQGYLMMGRPDYAAESQKRAQVAWTRHRADEPFRVDAVTAAWRHRPDAPASERLEWLRALLRNGEYSSEFVSMAYDLARRPDFGETMNQLFIVATADESQDAFLWEDRLSPETFRIAALVKAQLVGRPAEGVDLARRAVAMYDKAGPRLFAGRSAALHEQVRYAFAVDPVADAQEKLALLADAYTGFWEPVDADKPLLGDMGWTRLRILLAAGREKNALMQLQTLVGDPDAAYDESLSHAYLGIAAQFASNGAHADRALAWAQRAGELTPLAPGVYQLLTHIHLQMADDASALEAAKQYLELSQRQAAEESSGSAADAEAGDVEDDGDAYAYLLALERRYPESTIWNTVRSLHPDFPPAEPDEPLPTEAASDEPETPTEDAAPTEPPTGS